MKKPKSTPLGATLMDVYGFEDAYENPGLWDNELLCRHSERQPTRLFAERIPDANMRDELQRLLMRAVDPSPDKRPDMKTFISELQVLRNRLLDLSAKVSRIAYLDVNEFLAANRSQKQELLVALKAASEVQLYASEPHDKTKWAQVKVALEKQGIPVTSSVVLSAPGISMMERLTDNTRRRDASSQLIYNAFFVTAKSGKDVPASSPTVQVIQTNKSTSLGRCSYYDKKMHDSLVADVTPDHWAKIENIMQAQIHRLKQKNHFDPRIEMMQDFVNAMRESNPTYKFMLDQMSRLETRMLSQRKGSGKFFEQKTGIATSTTTKALREASGEVVKEVSKPGRKPT